MLKYSSKWNLQCNMNKTTDTEKEENRKAKNVDIVCMVVIEVYLFIYFFRGKARKFGRRDETK